MKPILLTWPNFFKIYQKLIWETLSFEIDTCGLLWFHYIVCSPVLVFWDLKKCSFRMYHEGIPCTMRKLSPWYIILSNVLSFSHSYPLFVSDSFSHYFIRPLDKPTSKTSRIQIKVLTAALFGVFKFLFQG